MGAHDDGRRRVFRRRGVAPGWVRLFRGRGRRRAGACGAQHRPAGLAAGALCAGGGRRGPGPHAAGGSGGAPRIAGSHRCAGQCRHLAAAADAAVPAALGRIAGRGIRRAGHGRGLCPRAPPVRPRHRRHPGDQASPGR
ncbi:hypothetical protein G6F22_021164 [Rhizopus arrhizus]|nr:hypothetical protein G6F22_021164 [Rhizopus arrhizus]